MKRTFLPVVLLSILLAACSPASNQSQAGRTPEQRPAQPSRTLVMVVRIEPNALAARPLVPQAIASYLSRRLFNADLALLDGEGVARPYLAEALPALNTDSWKVFPDGRMETTYRLRPNLTWHNGSPLTGSDFVFGWQVYSSAEFGGASSPYNLIESVAAPEPNLVRITWKRLFGDAGALQSTSPLSNPFPPLPRAVLEPVVQSESSESLVNHTFWTQNYVGLGPYRLTEWVPGSYYLASGFQGHVLGAPKIERLKVLFMPDGNAVLASMLAGDIQFSADLGLQVSHVPLLLSQWGPGKGTAIQHPNQWRVIYVQLRQEYANPKSLLDARVRKALAHAIDKDIIVETVYEGQAPVSDAYISPRSEVGKAIDAAITKYPLDLRRSAELMTQAGYARGADGIYASPTEGRFVSEIKSNAGVNFEAEMSIMAHGWGQAGFSIQEVVVPTALAQDPEIRGQFPGLFASNTNVGEGTAIIFNTANTPRPDNRWSGNNRSAYFNARYEELADQFTMTLERPARVAMLIEMARIFSEDLPAIALSFQPQPWVFVSDVRGPTLAASEANMSWNIYEWEWTS